MTRRIISLLLAMFLLFASLCAQAGSCQMCNGAGYLEMPAFGSNELMQVNCPACGGTLAATEAPAGASAPAQSTGALQLIDPGDYAGGEDQCVYAESWYAVFECEDGYDIDGYIAALTASTGLALVKQLELSGETDERENCYFQLTHPDFAGALYRDSCHASVYYNAYSDRISLAVADGGSVLLPDRARNLKFYTLISESWMPGHKSVTLPDPLPYANGEDEITKWTASSISYRCPEGYDIDGYIDLLRYQYGFDVDAIASDYASGATRYALNNPDIDARSVKIKDSSEFDSTRRQLEISYSFDGILRLYTADYSSVQLPLRPGAYVIDATEQIDLHVVPTVYIDMHLKKGTQTIYLSQPTREFQDVVNDLSKYMDFDVTGIDEDGNTTTYYLFMPGFHDLRLSNGVSHMSISHNSDTEEMVFDFNAKTLVMPEPKPRPTPGPKPSDDDFDGGGGGGGGNFDDERDTKEERCSICNGDGERDCSTCGGSGYTGYGSDRHRCPSFNCNSGKVKCWTCGGDGKK